MNSEQPQKPRRIRQLVQVAWQRPWLTSLTVLTALAATLFELTLPLLTGGAIDIALGNTGDTLTTDLLDRFSPSGISVLTSVIALIVILALFRYASQFGRRYTAGKLSIGVQHDIRLQTMHSLQKLDGPGQDSIRTGQVVSRSISDINMVQGIIAMLPMLIGNVVKLVLTLVIMLAISPPLTIIAAVLVPLLLWAVAYSRKALFASTWSAQQKAADLTTHVEETVTGIRVVKAFAQEDRETDKLDLTARELFAQRMRTAKLTAKFIPMVEQLPQLALVINIVGGGYLAMTGQITVGTFVAFSAYLTSLSAVARSLSGMLMRIQLALSSVERIFEVIDLAPHHQDPQRPKKLPNTPLGLAFDHVDFRGILNNFDLEVEPGETVVLVGPPGAGKTMAVQLAGSFYQPEQGQISFIHNGDKTDFADLTHSDIRANVVAVFDEPFLYSTSIRDNIAMGLDVTDAQVEDAAKLAQAHEFISQLPNHYGEVIGERGLTLSGGQRQRIALARAFLAHPKVLVLDDATSAIDASTEDRIFQALREALHDVTLLIIAHRHSTLELGDRVGLVENGTVTALGSLPQMRDNARFSHLMALDFQEATSPEFTLDNGNAVPSHEQLWPDIETEKQYKILAPGQGRGRGMSMPATPELLAQIEALPAATETPRVDVDRLRTTTDGFKLLSLFKQVRWLIAGVIALLLVGVAADLAFPTLMRTAIDNGVQAQSTTTLWWIAILGGVVVLVSWAAAALNTIITARTGERLLYGLRLRSFVHLLRLSMSYFERTMSGRIMTRMTTDIDNLSSFLQTGLAQTVVSAGTLIGVITMLLITDAQLALVALSVVPIIIVLTLIFRRISSRLYTEAREQSSQVNAVFHEAIAGLRTSQMHRMEDDVYSSYAMEAEEYRRLRVKSQTAIAIYFPGLGALSEIAQALVLGFGAMQVTRGDISTGVLVAFVLYMGLMFGPIQQLSQIFDSYQQAAVGFRRITELLSTQPSVPDLGVNRQAKLAARQPLMLNDVTFGYTDTPILEHVSVQIEPGTTVAIVGPTGAGKSTVVKLLSRLYDPSEGSVQAGGIDIKDFPTKDWRRMIGHVPQEAHLFSGTIAENIGYGCRDASTSTIEAAARRVGALNAIAAIPDGFNHQVGERGRNLSSGQRQLIALARAELIEPAIMLLDEATSTLDPATEAVILNASDRVTKGRTSIIVAHRLATAKRADRILVVDQGRIIEDGSHDALLSVNDIYARMWHLMA
ncbi:ABC transporter ATP-binding protein [Corynebacterium crudilactis]|uniref:ABC transporter ATP-binding protein n=1 Tax=Corynebacterium crudilactis TaxID=1652495 RepID=A0A172QSS4_9CORY|nr:ABC transporter ATP-binding protein [Corynebacterium crudilactis]ANE03710.1 ABC transporter ATP-binding protein [Corynebacterium crudilactis]